jgi:hypothetical protein
MRMRRMRMRLMMMGMLMRMLMGIRLTCMRRTCMRRMRMVMMVRTRMMMRTRMGMRRHLGVAELGGGHERGAAVLERRVCVQVRTLRWGGGGRCGGVRGWRGHHLVAATAAKGVWIGLERWYGSIVKGVASAELCIFVVTSEQKKC